MTDINKILDILDPYEDPEEGVDFYIEDNAVFVPNRNAKIAGKIKKIVDQSKIFNYKLVKIGMVGDDIKMGFDTVADTPSLHIALIGEKSSYKAEVKSDGVDFYVYLNSQRQNKKLKTFSQAKRYIKILDLQIAKSNIPNTYQDSDQDDE